MRHLHVGSGLSHHPASSCCRISLFHKGGPVGINPPARAGLTRRAVSQSVPIGAGNLHRSGVEQSFPWPKGERWRPVSSWPNCRESARPLLKPLHRQGLLYAEIKSMGPFETLKPPQTLRQTETWLTADAKSARVPKPCASCFERPVNFHRIICKDWQPAETNLVDESVRSSIPVQVLAGGTLRHRGQDSAIIRAGADRCG